MNKNPFSVKTPETLSAEDIASLFVDVFSDFPRLLAPEHTFLHGARGTGKSMMLRYLEPEVQIAANKVTAASELEYYAIHIPIKSPVYALSELEYLDGAPYLLMAEHYMICSISVKIINSLKFLVQQSSYNDIKEFTCMYQNFRDHAGKQETSEAKSVEQCINDIHSILLAERRNSITYLNELTFSQEFKPYKNQLFSYDGFFIPFLQCIRKLKLTPSGPIFLMIDDGDNLPTRMQKILNGWVSYRTTDDVCLKISTQQRYKTWRTPQETLIERAHDFSEIDINTVYTSKQTGHYYDRVKDIVVRRLKIYGIDCTDPDVFFPEDENQRKKLDAIKKKIGDKWDNGSRVSARKNDDIIRYAFSELVKELAETKKTNLLSYAGFKTLVDISSGVVRYFLEPASRMYAEQLARDVKESEIKSIPSDIQNEVIYKWSEEYVLDEFHKLKQDEDTKEAESSTKKTGGYSRVEKLSNLLNSFGECFQEKLKSDDSERRFIAFMLTGMPSQEAREVLDLAIEWGYLTAKTIARKEGVGRNITYTLNRRLAPYFKLDPSGYAAHLSVTPEQLTLAMENPRAFLRQKLKKNEEIESAQQAFDLQEQAT